MPLGIHVLNAGIGESIVVELPTGVWGVVDCYTSRLDDPESNPTLRFLKERGVGTLEFLCLTHPHNDHFRGMSHLLENLKVKYFWRFGAFTPRDLKKVLLYYLKTTAELEGGDTVSDADEVTKIFSSVYHQKTRGDIEKIFTLSDLKPLYPLPIGSDPDFEIQSIAPSSNITADYEMALGRCFDDKLQLTEKVPHQRHNDVSVALIIRYGETRVILGGDVEAANWRDSIGLLQADGFYADCVKVSHHGSTTGYTSALWPLLSGRRKPCAVVTPFRRFGLPKEDALRHIYTHCSSMLTTCRSATPGGTANDASAPLYDFKVQALLENRFRELRPYQPPRETGICSIILERNGKYSYSCSGSEASVVDWL